MSSQFRRVVRTFPSIRLQQPHTSSRKTIAGERPNGLPCVSPDGPQGPQGRSCHEQDLCLRSCRFLRLSVVHCFGSKPTSAVPLVRKTFEIGRASCRQKREL